MHAEFYIASKASRRKGPIKKRRFVGEGDGSRIISVPQKKVVVQHPVQELVIAGRAVNITIEDVNIEVANFEKGRFDVVEQLAEPVQVEIDSCRINVNNGESGGGNKPL